LRRSKQVHEDSDKGLRDLSKVVYKSKGGKEEKIFDALEWLAAMCSHVPNKGQQMVRYVGFYSNVARGKRKKNDQDELIPSILEPESSAKEYKRNWARLIQKIYEIDPLILRRRNGFFNAMAGLWVIRVHFVPSSRRLMAHNVP
jgi:Putative transposase